MKVRVPGWQLAAAARETPRARKGGSSYSVHYTVIDYDLSYFILDIFNVEKIGST